MAQPVKDIDALMAELRAWAREERGRQMILARATGVSKQAVSAWVKGAAVPTWQMGIKIEAFLKAQRPLRRKVAA
jgi:DNA-binding XRE family transcriptional regulator